MAELVDALVSGTSAARRGGSSPLLGTKASSSDVRDSPVADELSSKILCKRTSVVQRCRLASDDFDGTSGGIYGHTDKEYRHAVDRHDSPQCEAEGGAL